MVRQVALRRRIKLSSQADISAPQIRMANANLALEDMEGSNYVGSGVRGLLGRPNKPRLRVNRPEHRGTITNNLGGGTFNARLEAIEARLRDLSEERPLTTRFLDILRSGYSSVLDTLNFSKKPAFNTGKVYAGHVGKIYSVHWAGNNEDFASVSFDGRMLVWNVNDAKCEPRLNRKLVAF